MIQQQCSGSQQRRRWWRVIVCCWKKIVGGLAVNHVDHNNNGQEHTHQACYYRSDNGKPLEYLSRFRVGLTKCDGKCN